MAVSPQVIYKKFNILCPLEEEHNNMTSIAHHTAINVTDDFCEAKLFTVNSQVREKNIFTLPASAFLKCQLYIYFTVKHRFTTQL